MLNLPEEKPRIADLSVLPAFFKLRGKKVLLIGDSEALAWKLELVLAAGAEVRLISDLSCAALADKAAADHRRVTCHQRRWAQDDLENIIFAICDFDLEEEIKAFAACTHKRNILINIIDKPDYCDFQFGSIVNRSPVVVSISTSGSFPVLAQAIRTRIENLLPETLSRFAKELAKVKSSLRQKNASASQRRDFFQRLVRNYFAAPERTLCKAEETGTPWAEPESAGHVTLVGAGPGAGELLTLQALRALQSADIILFDSLVSDDVLQLARREAKRMLVGKRGHRPSCSQNEINALMVKLAKQGRHVVRLKSGDPMVFGRAGEELALLRRHGISTSVVPGVTAASAAASRFGISLTHRDHAQGVKFITGHSRAGQLPDLDWRSCADPNSTLLVYMGGTTAKALAKALMAQGLLPQTPVAVMTAISQPQETIVGTTLSALMDMTISVEDPVLIGIGNVFSDVAAQNIAAPSFYEEKEFRAV